MLTQPVGGYKLNEVLEVRPEEKVGLVPLKFGMAWKVLPSSSNNLGGFLSFVDVEETGRAVTN